MNITFLAWEREARWSIGAWGAGIRFLQRHHMCIEKHMCEYVCVDIGIYIYIGMVICICENMDIAVLPR